VLLLVLVVTVRPLLELALVLLVTPSPGLRDQDFSLSFVLNFSG